MKTLITLLVLSSLNFSAFAEQEKIILDCKTDDELNVTFSYLETAPELVNVKIEEEQFAQIIVNENSIKKNDTAKLKICSGTGCGWVWPYEEYFYAKLKYDKKNQKGAFRFVDRRKNDSGEAGRKRKIKQVDIQNCEARLRLFK